MPQNAGAEQSEGTLGGVGLEPLDEADPEAVVAMGEKSSKSCRSAS
jgi:hypothetical protein